jgi:antirestriction protein ArdC
MATTSERADVYQIITDRITAKLEQGKIPWRMPWKSTGEPRNFESKREYTGVNLWLLHSCGYTSPLWMTFKQIQERGGNVRKGEKACPVVFWKQYYQPAGEGDSGEVVTIDGEDCIKRFVLRYYNVFNAEQIEGIEFPKTAEGDGDRVPSIDQAESVIAMMPNKPEFREGGQASYTPALDVVTMPPVALFTSSWGYYGTVFHELAHSTGHGSRLGRLKTSEVAAFGSANYAKEELVAEMSAAYLVGTCGGSLDALENETAYIQGWLKALKDDKRMLVFAAAQAQKAADYILG